MQTLILAILLGLLLHEQFPAADSAPMILPALLLWLAVPLLAGSLYALACLYTLRSLTGPHALTRLRITEYLGSLLRILVLLAGLAALNLGALSWLRRQLGNTIALDEGLFLAPTLLFIFMAWLAWYPIDRRLRQAGLLARIDAGQVVYPIWSLSQYLLNQFRHQVALFGLPLSLFLLWQEIVLRLSPTGSQTTNQDLFLLGSGGLALFFATPWLVRHIWRTRPLPPGPLRQRLETLCRTYRVRVREILLWQTFGTLANAVVLGFIRPLRYILLSDALLEHLAPWHIEAVMAHELAHIRKHHIPWLMVWAAALIQLLLWLVPLLLQPLHLLHETPQTATASTTPSPYAATTVDMLYLLIVAIAWAGLFGWVARRFERQADALAVTHIAQALSSPPTQNPAPFAHFPSSIQRIDRQSILIVQQALQTIAQLNGISPRRPSWRHGSIAWRQQYLSTLAGLPVDQLPIHRQIRLLQIAGLLLLGLSLITTIL